MPIVRNEIRDFQKWDVDIIPHRHVMKTGFQTPDGKRVSVEDAFRDPQHPFRVAIVCAMLQAIARANRVFPGKDCGVIVDYNGMLKSLRAALAQYALADGEDGGEISDEIVPPIEDFVAALLQSIEAAETHLLGLGFDSNRLRSATRVCAEFKDTSARRTGSA